VSESESESVCDFCGFISDELTPINDDHWKICDVCMDLHYRIMPRHILLKELEKRDNCSFHGLSYADCGCDPEWSRDPRRFPLGEEE